jgi:hypothetical protein
LAFLYTWNALTNPNLFLLQLIGRVMTEVWCNDRCARRIIHREGSYQLSFAYTYLKFVRTNPSVQFRLNMFKVLELHIVGMISFSTECRGTLSILSHTGSYYDVLFCHTRISVNCWIGLYMLELNKDQNSNQLGNPFAAVFHMAIFFNPKRWAVEYNMWSLSFFYCQCLLILTWLVSLQDCERKAIAKLYHHRQDERPGKGHAWPCLGAID